MNIEISLKKDTSSFKFLIHRFIWKNTRTESKETRASEVPRENHL